MRFSWAWSARDFLANLAPIRIPGRQEQPGDAPDLLN
jgi:hypothetical protein